MQHIPRSLGIDIGSTTTKLVFIQNDEVVYEKYERHLSRVRETALAMLKEAAPLLEEAEFTVAISGSAGMGIAQEADIDFVQEVYATGEVIRKLSPDTDIIIELGGEDAKVVFYDGGIDERMNGSCAGGTGAFIDQMAILLNMSVSEMDEASMNAQRLYPIASRCGVFAKSDIQPLLNQGANIADIAASIYQAVVNQTITGLIQGRKIKGKVMFLGGPLHYCKGLRKRFAETLKLDENTAIFPEYDRFAVAMGAAMYISDAKPVDYHSLLNKIEKSANDAANGRERLPALFESAQEYEAFRSRHAKADVVKQDISSYTGDAWLGIDCGSTTTKIVLISRDKTILYSYYSPNKADPVNLVAKQLKVIREKCGERINIAASSVTGYGEELIKHAFHIDEGVVETIAHYTAAKYFRPDVDFILDIGGQDIKCFWIKNSAIDSLMLNEACSSGCGSFVETFAKSMGYTVEDFAKLGILSSAPVNLGSRCTVFMNSSVKQSQKDGASAEDISAGLSISVVKNAVYKVIRAVSANELGKCIVVQGGTFCNDAILRAFEQEIGANVIRPNIAGLMGAYGAALHVMTKKNSTLLTLKQLDDFSHTSSPSVCNGCANHCHLTINRFADGGRFVSGNQCQKALGLKISGENENIYEWKRNYFENLIPKAGTRGKLGLPMQLSMYELVPLWYEIFTRLGYEVHISPISTRETYNKGQYTIPSDTICYPAKLIHGHIEHLISEGINTIFYPSLTYNINEHASDNHYNCPVVAYYGEVMSGNIEELRDKRFIYPYLCIDNPSALTETLFPCLHQLDSTITKHELKNAVREGFRAYANYTDKLKDKAKQIIKEARTQNKRIMVLAGRPYHVDPEISHGIDKLANSLGFAAVSEDSVYDMAPIEYVKVLDQWTFHARLYRAARYAAQNKDVELVQLVSFGCGVDAITTDEVRTILEKNHKHYTQIKIDEITNLGTVKVRLRSLLGALEDNNS